VQLPSLCVRAARYITQFYDQHLAAAGLRTTQYGILAKLKRHGADCRSMLLAAELVMDRTTLGRKCAATGTRQPDCDRTRSRGSTQAGSCVSPEPVSVALSGPTRDGPRRKRRFEDAYGGESRPRNCVEACAPWIASELGPFESGD